MKKIILISTAILPLLCGCSTSQRCNNGADNESSGYYSGQSQRSYSDDSVKKQYWDLQQQQRER